MLESIIGSILGGGATGLLGVIVQRYADYKRDQMQMQLEKQRGELEIAKRRIDIEQTQAEYAGKLRIAEEEGRTARDVAETGAFASTLTREPERYSDVSRLSPAQMWIMVLLDGFRGIVRPALTIYLCALTTYIWIQVREIVGKENLDAGAALMVWQMVVQTILYLTTTVVLWWFGTRNKQKQPGA